MTGSQVGYAASSDVGSAAPPPGQRQFSNPPTVIENEAASPVADWHDHTPVAGPVGESNAVQNPLGEAAGSIGKKDLSWWGAFMVQLITMIGAGILFFPGVFASLGFVLAIFYLIGAALMTGGFVLAFYYTVQRLKRIHPDAQIINLEDVGQLVFGTWFKWLYFIFVYATLAVLASTFLILIGELMTGFADIGDGQDIYNVPTSQFYWSLIFGIPQLIMAWIPDLKMLKYVLNCGVLAIGIVIINHIVLCSVAIGDDPVANDPDSTPARAVALFEDGSLETTKVILGSITTFIYGFGALIVSGQIINDMGENHHEFPKATISAHAVVFGIYLLFGALGYGAFGTAPPPSFLSPESLIYDEYNTYWAIGAACTVTNASVTIPIFFNSLNRGLVRLMPEDKQENWMWVYGMRTMVVLICMAVACTPVSYFDDLTGLIPMCTVACISVLFPIALYWGGHEMEWSHKEKKEQNSSWKDVIKAKPWMFALHTLIVVIVVIAVIFGFWVSLEGLIDNIEAQ